MNSARVPAFIIIREQLADCKAIGLRSTRPGPRKRVERPLRLLRHSSGRSMAVDCLTHDKRSLENGGPVGSTGGWATLLPDHAKHDPPSDIEAHAYVMLKIQEI